MLTSFVSDDKSMADAVSPTTKKASETTSGCALIGNPGEEKTASGKELVVYSKPHTLPADNSCSAVVQVEGDGEAHPLMTQFCWDADWAWSVHQNAVIRD